MLSLPTSDGGLMLIKQPITTNLFRLVIGAIDLEQESSNSDRTAVGAIGNRDLPPRLQWNWPSVVVWEGLIRRIFSQLQPLRHTLP